MEFEDEIGIEEADPSEYGDTQAWQYESMTG
jgi:hypothetical protein